ncbi:MAG TPA: T9SS type A sorting domain-containing protein [Flavobacteriaceae bacterium]|nr:T9SS type A sorting domain-containing protein [Flavobacteriaceae bacterium]
MKNLYLFAFLIFPFFVFSQSFTTPGTGVNWTLDDIIAQSPSTLSFDGTNYTLNEELIVSQNDTLRIDTGLTLLIADGIRVTVSGTFLCDAGDQQITIDAVDEATPYDGFRFEEVSEVSIQNTYIAHGGGLKVITPDFSATNCTFSENVSGVSTGAAISLSNGSPQILNNIFSYNDLPAVSSGANTNVSASIIGNFMEANGQSNQNRPQINMGTTGTDTLRIVGNTIMGDPAMDQVGGIAVANLVGGQIVAIIDDNLITNNRYGLTIAGGNAFAYIRGNIIEDNDTQNLPNIGGSGISLNSNTDTQTIIVSNNQFRRNLWGITVIGEASINLGDGAENPGENIFADNGNSGQIYALYNNTDNTLQAKNNCWIEGQDNTSADAESVIFHQVDDSSLGLVVFDPIGCQNWGTENVAIQNFAFYPNPAQNEIHFSNTNNFETVKIFSLRGRLLEKTILQPGSNNLNLDLPHGIYLLQFIRDGQKITKKLIVK